MTQTLESWADLFDVALTDAETVHLLLLEHMAPGQRAELARLLLDDAA
jgi:hypothetical protein